jgi:hypothetical protein
MEHGAQAVEPLVRDLHHADARLGGAVRGGMRVAARNGVEGRRLARLLEADDAQVHRRLSLGAGDRGCQRSGGWEPEADGWRLLAER